MLLYRYYFLQILQINYNYFLDIVSFQLGKQMLHNYERLTHEISMWDLREPEASGSTVDEATCQMLNHDDLNDSRMSVPEPGSRHSVIQVHNNNSSSTCDTRDVMNIEVLAIPPRKASESGSGGGSDGRLAMILCH